MNDSKFCVYKNTIVQKVQRMVTKRYPNVQFTEKKMKYNKEANIPDINFGFSHYLEISRIRFLIIHPESLPVFI